MLVSLVCSQHAMTVRERLSMGASSAKAQVFFSFLLQFVMLQLVFLLIQLHKSSHKLSFTQKPIINKHVLKVFSLFNVKLLA